MHYFNVATNLCQRFMIGYPEEKDNFYLEGETRLDEPIVSCRIYDSEGKFLYGLSQGKLSTETPSKYRFALTKEGWHRVVDDKGIELLRIESKMDEKGDRITYILGDFYDKHGKLAARGTLEGLLANCPLKMG